MNLKTKATIYRIALFSWMGATGIYIFYGYQKGHGLMGVLMDWQFRLPGEASLNLTFLAGILILWLPALLIVPKEYLGSRAAPVAVTQRPPSAVRRWSILLLVSLFLSIIPEGAYLALQKMDQADQQSEIYGLDLRDAPPSGAKFIRVEDFAFLRLRYSYKEKFGHDSHDFFPLVSPKWKPNQPVAYFFEGTPTRDTFVGRLDRNDLPVFVRTAFRRGGISIAAPHYVIRQVGIENGKIASWISEFTFLPWVGVIAGGLTLLIGGFAVFVTTPVRRRSTSA